MRRTPSRPGSRSVIAAGDVYAPNLIFGLPRVGLAGHWKDELAELRKGLAVLEGQRLPQVASISSLTENNIGQRVKTIEMENGRYEVTVAIDGGDKGAGPMWIESRWTRRESISGLPLTRNAQERRGTERGVSARRRGPRRAIVKVGR